MTLQRFDNLMIDIHSHILPGVDDGAKDLDDALAMARLAVADGATHLFATPHHIYFTPLTRKEVRCRVNVLQQALDDAGIALTVVPGHEVRLYEDVLADWEVELAGPLGDSRYVLAEPDFYRFDRSIVRIVLKMIDRGFIPVLAHPERIIPIQEDLSLIEPILERGGLTQVTTDNLVPPDRDGAASAKADSIISSKAARHTAREMLRRGWVHMIASDAHNTSSRRPGLSAARDAAAKIVGLAQAQAMVTTNPRAIVDDEPLQMWPDQAGLAAEPPL